MNSHLTKKETFINTFFNILNTRFCIQAAAALFIQCRQWVSLSAERASGVIPTDCPSRCSLQRGATTIHSPDPFSPFTNKVTPSIFIWIAENRVVYGLQPVCISGTGIICSEVSYKPPHWRPLWGTLLLMPVPAPYIIKPYPLLVVSPLVYLFLFVIQALV